MNFSIFFTTNVRPVTTLDDLRFMTSLPVVDLTSCSRYLIFLNAQSMVALRIGCRLVVVTGMNLCSPGGPDIPIFAQLDAAIVGIAQQRKPPPEARVLFITVTHHHLPPRWLTGALILVVESIFLDCCLPCLAL
jgi:hypothetical protein